MTNERTFDRLLASVKTNHPQMFAAGLYLKDYRYIATIVIPPEWDANQRRVSYHPQHAKQAVASFRSHESESSATYRADIARRRARAATRANRSRCALRCCALAIAVAAAAGLSQFDIGGPGSGGGRVTFFSAEGRSRNGSNRRLTAAGTGPTEANNLGCSGAGASVNGPISGGRPTRYCNNMRL